MHSDDSSNKKEYHLPFSPYGNDYQPKKDELTTTAIDYSTLTSHPLKSREVIVKVITDRITFLKKTIDEINAQIEERERLKDTLNSDID